MTPVLLNPSRFATGGGGGGTLALTAGTAQNSSGASPWTITLPAGAAAGNLVVIVAGARWNFTGIPTGWTVADANDGSFFNGRTIWKILSSADVSAGSISISLGGSSLEACTVLLITGASSTPTVAVRSTQRWGGGGSALLAAQPSNSFSAASGSLMLYAGVNDSTTAMTISRGTQAGSANISTLIVAHANSEVLAAALTSVTATFNSGASTSAYYVVLEITP